MRWMYQKPGKHDVEIEEPKMFKKPEKGLFEKAFLNIVTILGSARSGKSTLMNSIIGKDVFATSDSMMYGCTEGIWLSEDHDNIADGAVVYVDTQGQDNDSLENSSKLLAPVVFLSKVIILNIMGASLQQQVLEKLKIFLHICERIKHQNNPAENLKLGHLIITARDFSFKGTEKDVYDYLFKEETGSEKSVRERNDIRKKIRVVFGEPTVFLFRKSLVEMETNGDLKKRVDDLKRIIHEKVSKPREFCSNTCLKPDNVDEITKIIVDQLNAPNEAFELQSIVDLAQQREDVALKRFDRDIKDIDERSPCKREVERELVHFSDEEKEKKISENNKRLEERKIIIEQRDAFNNHLKKNITNIKIPITNIENCLREIEDKLFETFDINTQVVELELDYREKARNELGNRCTKKVDEKIKENKKVEADAPVHANKLGALSVFGIAVAMISIVIFGAPEATNGVIVGAGILACITVFIVSGPTAIGIYSLDARVVLFAVGIAITMSSIVILYAAEVRNHVILQVFTMGITVSGVTVILIYDLDARVYAKALGLSSSVAIASAAVESMVTLGAVRVLKGFFVGVAAMILAGGFIFVGVLAVYCLVNYSGYSLEHLPSDIEELKSSQSHGKSAEIRRFLPRKIQRKPSCCQNKMILNY